MRAPYVSAQEVLIGDVREFIRRKTALGACRVFDAEAEVAWPAAGPGQIVLMPDLALELGHPEQASLCFHLWTRQRRLIRDGAITLIGPDIAEAATPRLPFAKAVLAAIDAEDPDDVYDLYRKMDLVRFNLSLRGFMLRATSQYMREWSRISREAVAGGLSLQTVGSALIRDLKAIRGVTAVEVLFVTQCDQAVAALQQTAVQAGRIIQAMHKMMNEMETDCDSCAYQDVCDRASELAALQKTLAGRGGRGG